MPFIDPVLAAILTKNQGIGIEQARGLQQAEAEKLYQQLYGLPPGSSTSLLGGRLKQRIAQASQRAAGSVFGPPGAPLASLSTTNFQRPSLKRPFDAGVSSPFAPADFPYGIPLNARR